MEIISLNTSLFFSMRKMNGAIKSLCDLKACDNHRYVHLGLGTRLSSTGHNIVVES